MRKSKGAVSIQKHHENKKRRPQSLKNHFDLKKLYQYTKKSPIVKADPNFGLKKQTWKISTKKSSPILISKELPSKTESTKGQNPRFLSSHPVTFTQDKRFWPLNLSSSSKTLKTPLRSRYYHKWLSRLKILIFYLPKHPPPTTKPQNPKTGAVHFTFVHFHFLLTSHKPSLRSTYHHNFALG